MTNPAFWSRLRQVLTSVRTLISLGSFLVTILIVWLPELQTLQNDLMTFIVMGLLLLSGYTLRDAVRISEQLTDDERNPDLIETDLPREEVTYARPK